MIHGSRVGVYPLPSPPPGRGREQKAIVSKNGVMGQRFDTVLLGLSTFTWVRLRDAYGVNSSSTTTTKKQA